MRISPWAPSKRKVTCTYLVKFNVLCLHFTGVAAADDSEDVPRDVSCDDDDDSDYQPPGESATLSNSSSESSPSEDEDVSATTTSMDVLLNRESKRRGEAYLTKKGKKVDAKKRDTPSCKLSEKQCAAKWTEKQNLDKMFEDFWAGGTYSQQKQFLNDFIQVQTSGGVSRESRAKEGTTVAAKKQRVVAKYSLPVGESRHPCCKACFMKILGVTRKQIDLIVSKKSDKSIIRTPDQRGKQKPSHVLSEETASAVKAHILSFPSTESHYSRAHTSRRYLGPHLNVTKMHDLYQISGLGAEVSYSTYYKIFKGLKLSFRPPYLDTCRTCDSLKMRLKHCAEDTRDQLTAELEEHQRVADFGYRQKRLDKVAAQNSNDKTFISFDLQQCLPTPDLKTSVVFYKRVLWTYNFTVRNELGQGFCFLWHEGVSGRGSDEIASCLYSHLESVKTKMVTAYSDSCGGQNRNSNVACMFMSLVQLHPNIEVVDHKFLEPGHTHLECDSDQAVIEKKKKGTEVNIFTPRDWLVFISSIERKCGGKMFHVHDRLDGGFKAWSKLQRGSLVNRKKDTAGNKVEWLKIRWMRYDKSAPGQIQFKYSLQTDDNFRIVDFRRNNRIPLAPLIPTDIPSGKAISTEKLKDIHSLFEFLPPDVQLFFKTLRAAPKVSDVHPMDVSRDDIED